MSTGSKVLTSTAGYLNFAKCCKIPNTTRCRSLRNSTEFSSHRLPRDLEKTKAQTIMWSLDGVLRYLPVATLHDGKQYLVERYCNVVFTPASQARLKDLPAQSWDALGLGVSKAHGERIPALPGVIDEMHGIIRDESAAGAAAPGSQTGVLPRVVKLEEQLTQHA